MKQISDYDVNQARNNVGCCSSCYNLNKHKFKELDNGIKQKLYACNGKLSGYVTGWVRSENELFMQGGSCFKQKKDQQQKLF